MAKGRNRASSSHQSGSHFVEPKPEQEQEVEDDVDEDEDEEQGEAEEEDDATSTVSVDGGEKARKSQELVSGSRALEKEKDKNKDRKQKRIEAIAKAAVAYVEKAMAAAAKAAAEAESEPLDDKFNCAICLNTLKKPVSTPCGHNFCLKCFQYSARSPSNRTCPLCRHPIPLAMVKQPKINLLLVQAIRNARIKKSNSSSSGSKGIEFIHNRDKPDHAYTTERAKRKGKANAASGRIFVTVPIDHFGPILAENDPERNRGVLVGDTWECRLECRQWGVHFPPVCGISGRQDHGAQSVVLSGGYDDDFDNGEWFLYTGSGGRDLSGNKRTNKNQSFDQKFKAGNEALRVSCINGYPVRVIRSCKIKHSAYAPDKGLRYDGIYRIEQCWLNPGVQGFKVCRYLFVRCDNDPAPWTSDLHGDRPRTKLPFIHELYKARDLTGRKQKPSWDFDEADGRWKWMKPPPISKHKGITPYSDTGSRKRRMRSRGQHSAAALKRLQKDYGCLICKQVLEMPVTTPCAHNFCKACLEKEFSGQSSVRERNAGGRALRSQKNVMKCPACPADLSEYLNNLKVNIELKTLIEMQIAESEEHSDNGPVDDDDDDDDEDNNVEEGAADDQEEELKPEKCAKQRKVDDNEEGTD